MQRMRKLSWPVVLWTNFRWLEHGRRREELQCCAVSSVQLTRIRTSNQRGRHTWYSAQCQNIGKSATLLFASLTCHYRPQSSGPLMGLNPYAFDNRGGFTQSPFPARQTWRRTLCFLAFFHDVTLDLQAHCVHTKACLTSLSR